MENIISDFVPSSTQLYSRKVLFLYCSSRKVLFLYCVPCSWKSVLWITSSDSYGDCYIQSTTQLSSVFSEKAGRIFVRSLVFREVSRFSTSFWMQNISSDTLILTDTNERNFSFIICSSVISQNTINFRRKKNKNKDRFVISRGTLLKLNRFSIREI